MHGVLIVDDNKDFRKKYKKLFKEAGFTVVVAPDAVEVADVLMRDLSKLDIIILDIQMPEVDGRGIYEIIHEYAPSIPFIVASVLPIPDQKLRVPRATDYFNKADKDEVIIAKAKAILGI